MPAQNAFGLDIGSSTTKLIQLSTSGDKFDLIAHGIISSPPRALASEAIEDQEDLSEALKRLVDEARPSTKNVITALPESQIFTRVIDMPLLSESELASALKWEAEQYVPLPLSDVELDWQILDQIPGTDAKNSKMEILLVAAPKLLVEKYMKVLNMVGLNPLTLETEPIALNRSLLTSASSGPTTLIISFGASTTDVCIIRSGKLTFTRSIATGGIALSRAVAQDLGFELAQAEEYKKTYGLDASQLEGKVMQSIKPVFDVVVNEIRRALAYYLGKRPDDPIKRAVVTGGSAKMPGLVVYLANSLGVEVQIGNPWERVNLSTSNKQNLIDQSEEYATCVGLAMREDND